MTTLYAQPYDLSATGFYFDTYEQYRAKANAARNMFGQKVEEFQIQFIDGDAIDCDLAQAWGINQNNCKEYLEAVDEWEDHGKTVFIIAVGEAGYSFDPETMTPNDFDVDIYHVRTIKDLAEEFVAEGLFGEIPDHLSHYIDYDAIARDLAVDYTETEIAGDCLIYRVA